MNFVDMSTLLHVESHVLNMCKSKFLSLFVFGGSGDNWSFHIYKIYNISMLSRLAHTTEEMSILILPNSLKIYFFSSDNNTDNGRLGILLLFKLREWLYIKMHLQKALFSCTVQKVGLWINAWRGSWTRLLPAVTVSCWVSREQNEVVMKTVSLTPLADVLISRQLHTLCQWLQKPLDTMVLQCAVYTTIQRHERGSRPHIAYISTVKYSDVTFLR